MKHIISTFLLMGLLLLSGVAKSEVYGGDEWAIVGLGSMPCDQFIKKYNKGSYREGIRDWLSGFMSGVNFSSSGVNDISNGRDTETILKKVEKQCEHRPDKLFGTAASDVMYTRHHTGLYKKK